MGTRRWVARGLVLAVLLVVAACATPEDDGRLRVYATTGHLADAVRAIAPHAQVSTMVGPGSDPHSYQPSTRDITTIHSSDVVFWVGLHLEAQMDDQLRSLGHRQVAVGERVPRELLLEVPSSGTRGTPVHDPHIWNSLPIWSLVVDVIADALAEVDPSGAADYAANAADYQDRLAAVHERAGELLARVPPPRMVVTGHDAFGYLGATYDLDVRATDLVSTEARLRPRQLSALADLVAGNRVPVIFTDNQANPQAITSLKEAVHALGWQVQVADQQLYADSLGNEAGVDTHLGVLLHNATVIADALGEP
ncbi:metal ABC transporter substrate-binding protein [Aestuariimicrobium sp. Y1814]|uniref:metal ABC transporter substrate-binding protein n=1 Tax=Aestuariimicrobium sp. Y1814 TaxID=3418742 RepID=UPI003DA7383B